MHPPVLPPPSPSRRLPGFMVGAVTSGCLTGLCAACYTLLSGNLARGQSLIDMTSIVIGALLGGTTGALLWSRRISTGKSVAGAAAGYGVFFALAFGALTLISYLRCPEASRSVLIHNYWLGLALFGPQYLFCGAVTGYVARLTCDRTVGSPEEEREAAAKMG